MRPVDCSLARHGEAILAILNEAIVNSTALYDYQPHPPDSMPGWFRVREEGRFPVIGIEDDAGELLGFGTYGPFRPHAAYKYSVEHSVYVRAQSRGLGLGRLLLQELIARAAKQGMHALVGGIDTDNDASIALHRSLGFVHAGTIRQAGFKFGRWLDLALYQLLLATPEHPVDG